MDLWKQFEMNERMADMWQELGVSAGTAIVVLAALYFIVKWAVKNGMTEAYKKIMEKKAHDDIKAHNDIKVQDGSKDYKDTKAYDGIKTQDDKNPK